ncbi:SusE outer membrane protein [Flavobacterium caeni]|uniref:SusE outer membrane protein n=2 Tax=Flavobacterium caeni TaxID=490189 RepID=A0A1G5JWZ8_9FLAO|nr:SusE outer membrane protein [Flavobacterium caeni]
MKNRNQNTRWAKWALMLPSLLLVLFSCTNDDELNDNIGQAGPLKLSVSTTELVLDPSMYLNNFTFTWTTGTNQNTGSSISYKLEIDKTENNFSNPIEYDFGTNKYAFDLNVATLNQILLTTFNAQAGTPIALQARITATFADQSVPVQTSTVDLTFTPYQPLTTTLFIVGSATPNGWDIGNSAQLTVSSTNPAEFVYNGQLSNGTFKFAVNQDGCFCQDFYTKDPTDSNKMVYNQNGSGDDLQWNITDAGNYTITVNVLDLTINIQSVGTPPFTQLWMVGDATPSGWNIDTPQPFTVTADPYIFTYEATLTPGNFKILAGATGNWCGQWYRPLVDNQVLTETTVAQNSGCDVDNKWQVTSATAGRYKITLNTLTNVINITPVEVYLIGDATPNGWNMGSFTPMSKSGGVYTWTGNLNAGEFKFTKFNTNWCDGTEIVAASPSQSISNTAFGFNENCSGNDYKWVVTAAQAGTHTITLNLNTNSLTIN